ncbi:hypothetical protein BOX15_Mlig019713g2 [Macrostomum lignano]|uniref:THAP-type domain-containing protein n=1 Tax=Macrostomum lignano TaxID=282301 RepID=A0A267GQD6_9PLAT|nr:hypothetical protein BOX15_Mlig019713g3 [Macrostomum lignano]PAA88236.1 hypothetical protein BOX15_Mlig019713g2 [Macrostomum lignano]
MPCKCTVAGCKSGYDSHVTPASVSFHKFPTDQGVLAQWLQQMSREPTYQPGKQTRVCSLHFLESDFVTESQDTNARRKRKKSGYTHEPVILSNRRLKREAVPTQFGDVGGAKASQAKLKSKCKSTSTSPTKSNSTIKKSAKKCKKVKPLPLRRRQPNAITESVFQEHMELFNASSIDKFGDLVQKFEDRRKSSKPAGFATLLTDSSFNIMQISVGPPPSVQNSIVVSRQLEVTVYRGPERLLPSEYQHIVPADELLNSVEQLNGLMTFVKSHD